MIAVSLRIKGTPAVWSFSFLCFLNMWVCGHVWRQGARTHTHVWTLCSDASVTWRWVAVLCVGFSVSVGIWHHFSAKR